MQYRKDIQILRGLSVLLVVLFHLEIAGFNSGFLGVDVFFVISGYLMAALYDPSKQMDFFLKRAKRLLPAYFATIILTVIVCIVLTIPSDYNQVANQAAFATVFSSNIGYWLENSYFDKSAFKPLLHLWSLGVEIQFYLCVPFLFLLFKRAKATYFILLIGSLFVCFFVDSISPKTSFFMMPLRLWEFLIGYGVAHYLTQQGKIRNRSANWLGVTSLIILICIPLFKIDGTKLNFIHGHPGIYALIICLATAVILTVGLPQKLESLPIANILEKLGQYSYSIYLVHFPVIVIFLYQPFSGTILKTSEIGQKFMLIAIIACLSLLMYHLVETPLRSLRETPLLLLACAIAVLAIAPWGMTIQESIIPSREMLIYQAWNDRAPSRCPLAKRLANPKGISCEITNDLEKPLHRTLLLGNSHSDMIKTSFTSVAQSKNVAVRFMVENNPLMEGGVTPQQVIDDVLANQVDSIVIHYSPEGIIFSNIEQVVMMAGKHHIPVSFILPVPVWDKPIPMALLDNIKRNQPLPKITLVDYQNKDRQIVDRISEMQKNYENLNIYEVADRFCQDTCEIMDTNGKPLYFDEGHLTLTGSKRLQGLFERVISDLITLPGELKAERISNR